jgi:flagellar biosynthesis protein FlhA
MDPALTEGIIAEIDPKIKEMTDRGLSPIIVTTTELRLAFRRFMEPSYPQLVVLSYQELPTETQIEPFGAIAIAAQSLPPDIISAMEESNASASAGEVAVAA